MEYYSATNRCELVMHGTGMTLKSITLRERSQTQRAMICMIPLIWRLEKAKLEGEIRLVVARAPGSEKDTKLQRMNWKLLGRWKCSVC